MARQEGFIQEGIPSLREAGEGRRQRRRAMTQGHLFIINNKIFNE